MERIVTIEPSLKLIQPKLDIGASDWTKEEKKAIEKCYFEITKVSVGWGRTVDLGCTECVQSAVNVIKNYQALIARSQQSAPVTEEKEDWKKNSASIQAEAYRLGIEFPKSVKKNADKIAFIEAYEPILEEEDLLGEEFTKEQLVEIIKAKTGDEVNADEYSYEELLETVKSLEDGEDEN